MDKNAESTFIPDHIEDRLMVNPQLPFKNFVQFLLLCAATFGVIWIIYNFIYRDYRMFLLMMGVFFMYYFQFHEEYRYEPVYITKMRRRKNKKRGHVKAVNWDVSKRRIDHGKG